MSKCIAKLLLCFGLVLVMPGCGREGSPADDFEEASASSWTVTLRFLSDDVARDFDFIATSPLWPSLVIPVRSSGGGNPEVRSWRAAPTGKNLYVLEYLAGLVGTYERVFEIRSAVVDLQSGKVIVDGASASLAFPNNEPSGWQPGWTWTEDELVIETGRGPRIIRLAPNAQEESTRELEDERNREDAASSDSGASMRDSGASMRGLQGQISFWTEWEPSTRTLPAGLRASDPAGLLAAVVVALGLHEGLGDWFNDLSLRFTKRGSESSEGVIQLWGIKDDSVGGQAYRVTMRLESNEWQVRGLDKSRYCSRGLTADGACL